MKPELATIRRPREAKPIGLMQPVEPVLRTGRRAPSCGCTMLGLAGVLATASTLALAAQTEPDSSSAAHGRAVAVGSAPAPTRTTAAPQATSNAKAQQPPTDKARAAARKAATAAAAAAAAAPTLALATEEQRHAFGLAHLGEYQCEFKRLIRVLANPRHEGYVDLHFDKQVVTARPVLSSTGAIRLEDVKGRFLMVQIAFKSMILDTRIGQRVADDCQHDNHHEARRAASEAPPAPGLGISTPPPQEDGPSPPSTR